MTPPVQLTASLHPKPWLVGSDESFLFGIPAYFQEFVAVSFWGSVLYQKRKCYKNPSLNSVKRKLPQMFLFDVFPWGFGSLLTKNRRETLRANRVTSPIVEPWHCCSAVPYTPQWHRLLKRFMIHDANMWMKWPTIFCITPLRGREWRVLWPFSSKAQQAQTCEEKYWWKNSNDHHLLWIFHVYFTRLFFKG